MIGRRRTHWQAASGILKPAMPLCGDWPGPPGECHLDRGKLWTATPYPLTQPARERRMIAIVTVIIASFVAVIAGLQWWTAQEKVLLDLFDRRFAVYEELRAVLGGLRDQDAYLRFKMASSRAQFLFGPEIKTFLDKIAEDLIWEMGNWTLNPSPVPAGTTMTVSAEVIERQTRLAHFFKDFDELIFPYMNHHQKMWVFPALSLLRSLATRTQAPRRTPHSST
jgi:hypothetical protein